MYRRFAVVAIAVGTYPLLLIGAISAAMVGLERGVDPSWLVSGLAVGSSLILLALQRIQPAVAEWRWWGRDAIVDLTHAIFSSGGATAVARGLTLGATLKLATWLATLGFAWWPSAWPLLLQLALALVLGDLGAYLLHRASHTYEPFWRLHALHHSSERLYVFSSGRNHPLHTAMTYLLQTVPLIVSGAPAEVLVLHATFTGVHGMLQHANIDLWHGPFNYVFATADLHRWHHGTAMEDSQSNYGNNVILWDHLFGTFRLPEGRPAAVGIEGVRFPRSWWLHLASPLLLERWSARD